MEMTENLGKRNTNCPGIRDRQHTTCTPGLQGSSSQVFFADDPQLAPLQSDVRVGLKKPSYRVVRALLKRSSFPNQPLRSAGGNCKLQCELLRVVGGQIGTFEGALPKRA
ncbi:hypothetical protein ACAN107058_10655 [Paracidovorax anthurii]|uniref:Uncharacterized protein n=1 Tax=Paracidovorax anthurii TaxID=78229 RepID=A0A328YV98_9BURK|nr:hypothetical protein AX018_104321 [Paracidovorax anthurii]